MMESEWKDENERIHGKTHAVTCQTENAWDNQIMVTLKGMCEKSNFDKEYFLMWMPMNNNPDMIPSHWYVGKMNSSIIYIADRKWAIHDGGEHWMWDINQINSM